jgi:hypothetical protein
MHSTEQHDGGSSDAQQKGERLSSSTVQPSAAESTNLADAGDDTSNISVMPVVGIKIPKSTLQSSSLVPESRHIILTLSKEQEDVAQMLQSQEGQAGSFFSIHSTIQEPVRYSLDTFPKEGDPKCCLCCAYKAATFEEQWSPYQPGKKKCSWSIIRPLMDIRDGTIFAGQVFFARADKNHSKYVVGEQHYVNGKLANPYAESTKELDDLRVQLAHIAQERPNPVETILKSYEPYKCCVARVEFDDFIKYIESLDTSDDGSRTATAMFASEMLSYYRPKGRLALISPFLHVALIVSACVPTMALFTLWGLNQYAYYCYTITQTTAFGFLFVCFYL